MIRIRLAVCVLSLACASAFVGCGDDDDDDDNGGAGRGGTGGRAGRDAGEEGGTGGTAGRAGRGGAGGRGGTGGAGVDGGQDAGPEVDAGEEIDAGNGNGNGNGNGEAHSARAVISAFGDAPGISGLAEFAQSGSDVTVVITLMDCPPGQHPVHIHVGSSCATVTAPGSHWDGLRGEGIPSIMCVGGEGALVYTRTAQPEDTAWSIGDGGDTDIVGHTFVVNTPGGRGIGCGRILLAE